MERLSSIATLLTVSIRGSRFMVDSINSLSMHVNTKRRCTVHGMNNTCMIFSYCSLYDAESMADKRNADIHPGRKIAARRAELGKSLMDIENETGGTLYVQLLYRLENAKKPLETLNVRQLKALDWTPQEFAEATGVEVPGAIVRRSEHLSMPKDELIRRQMLLGATSTDDAYMAAFLRRITPEKRKKIERALDVVEEAEKYLGKEVKDSIDVLEWIAKEVLKLVNGATANEGAG